MLDIFVSIDPVSGEEVWSSDQVQARVKLLVRTRWLPGVTPDMRLTVDGRTFEILDVLDPEDLHYELILGCVERV